MDDEVPHGIYVETDKMKFRKTIQKENIYDISATIYCLRDSHKGIIIGKNGQMLSYRTFTLLFPEYFFVSLYH